VAVVQIRFFLGVSLTAFRHDGIEMPRRSGELPQRVLLAVAAPRAGLPVKCDVQAPGFVGAWLKIFEPEGAQLVDNIRQRLAVYGEMAPTHLRVVVRRVPDASSSSFRHASERTTDGIALRHFRIFAKPRKRYMWPFPRRVHVPHGNGTLWHSVHSQAGVPVRGAQALDADRRRAREVPRR